jgi:dipeptidyl-peptidase-3
MGSSTKLDELIFRQDLQAHCAMFKVLSAVGGSFLTITDGKASDTITVKVDRDKNASHGNPAIADLMIKLHIWRCTADVKHYREYHVPLTEPTGVYLEWRRMMFTKQTPRQVFVQPNTFIRDGGLLKRVSANSRWNDSELG